MVLTGRDPKGPNLRVKEAVVHFIMVIDMMCNQRYQQTRAEQPTGEVDRRHFDLVGCQLRMPSPDDLFINRSLA
jgi:hypothetical protein